jgi:hypothetical protein
VSEVSSACGETCGPGGVCGGGGGGGCACEHDPCTVGTKLAATCDPCAAAVCAKDSYCCGVAWNSICVSEIPSVCGETCGSAGVCGAAGNSCAHDVCTTGSKLADGCNTCVTKLCAKDSYCCTTGWSSICVAEVGSICGQTCN